MSTCLIIGAGASHDISQTFCLGRQLIDEILALTSVGQQFHMNCMHQLSITKLNIDSFHRNLQEYTASDPSASIDEFLTEIELYPEYELVRNDFITIGKLAVIICILDWESKFLNECLTLKIEDTWLAKLVDYISNTNKYVDRNTLVIVSFNYDRLIEHILKFHFGVKPQLFEKIIHVYGKLPNDLEFGKTSYTLNELILFKDHIETIYHKRVNQKESELQRALYKLQNNIYIMGFGYDYFNLQNIQLVNYGNPDTKKKKLYTNIFIKENHPYRKRREETKRVRGILTYPNFSYLNCNNFIDFMLSDKK